MVDRLLSVVNRIKTDIIFTHTNVNKQTEGSR
jgi:hypothetical protein